MVQSAYRSKIKDNKAVRAFRSKIEDNKVVQQSTFLITV
uniref:Uncharacterized protein n=1 Tax=Aegilops tauschii subsp. strangulata TaxID=200361 RepID=A0A453R0I6_AEGTS